jgi:hypothetical protein
MWFQPATWACESKPAIGVDRQRATRADGAVLDEVGSLAGAAEAEALQAKSGSGEKAS